MLRAAWFNTVVSWPVGRWQVTVPVGVRLFPHGPGAGFGATMGMGFYPSCDVGRRARSMAVMMRTVLMALAAMTAARSGRVMGLTSLLMLVGVVGCRVLRLLTGCRWSR